MGDFVSRSTTMFYISSKLNNFQIFKYNIDFSWMWAIEHGLEPCMHVVIYFKMITSNMHWNEWFQVRFFKTFLGRGSPSPLPRPLPPFFLGLRPRFGLRPQFSGASHLRLGLRPRFLGASRSRFGLQLSIIELGLAPNINSWIRPWSQAFNHLTIGPPMKSRIGTQIPKEHFRSVEKIQIHLNMSRELGNWHMWNSYVEGNVKTLICRILFVNSHM